MNKVMKIFDRLTLQYVKNRTLLTSIVVQNVIFSIIVLIFANVITSNANITGELDYEQIKFFSKITITLLFLSATISTPLFMSTSLYQLYKKNIIEHLLSIKINIDDIIFATFLRGITVVTILAFSALPISCVAFYFGGFGILKFIKLIVCFVSYILLLSTFCIYFATKILDGNLSLVISYLMCFILLAANMLFLDTFLYGRYRFLLYMFLCSMTSLVLLALSRKTKIFVS